ncbi:hypothetical protein ACOMHN_023864 [Nucella lapillus]
MKPPHHALSLALLILSIMVVTDASSFFKECVTREHFDAKLWELKSSLQKLSNFVHFKLKDNNGYPLVNAKPPPAQFKPLLPHRPVYPAPRGGFVPPMPVPFPFKRPMPDYFATRYVYGSAPYGCNGLYYVAFLGKACTGKPIYALYTGQGDNDTYATRRYCGCVSLDGGYQSEACFNDHYKSRIVTNWKEKKLPVDKVRVSVYRGGVEQTYFVFNGQGSSPTDFFTQDRLLFSPYKDLNKETSTNYFSVDGHIQRRLFINQAYSGHCKTDRGWHVLLDGRDPRDNCPWTSRRCYPAFLYSTASTNQIWQSGETCKVRRMKTELCNLAKQDLVNTSSQVYSDWLANQVGDIEEEEVLPSLSSCRSMMNRARREEMPPLPASIAEIDLGPLSNTLRGDPFVLHHDDRMFVLSTPENLRALQDSSILFMDGTPFCTHYVETGALLVVVTSRSSGYVTMRRNVTSSGPFFSERILSVPIGATVFVSYKETVASPVYLTLYRYHTTCYYGYPGRYREGHDFVMSRDDYRSDFLYVFPATKLHINVRRGDCIMTDCFKLFFSFVPPRRLLQKLPSGLWNCSTRYYASVQHHMACNHKRECEDGRDETEHCPFSSPECQGLVALCNRCYQFVKGLGASYYRENEHVIKTGHKQSTIAVLVTSTTVCLSTRSAMGCTTVWTTRMKKDVRT